MAEARGSGSLRERTRAHVRAEIARAAWVLFDEQGFDATTTAQIAAAAGVSPRSFFRYFAVKEDLVIDDPVGYEDELVAALRARPAAEQPWTALRRTLRVRTAAWQAEPARAAKVLLLLAQSDRLRARLARKNRAWQTLLSTELAHRLHGPDRALAACALVGSAFSCLDAAFTTWQGDADVDLDALVDTAMAAVHPLST